LSERSEPRLLLLLFVGVLMAALDIAIVGPALPAIQDGFGVDARAAAWVFTVFVLFNLVATPTMAKLSDRWGRRPVYMLDIALFAAGSLVVALAPSFSVLLAGRALQAIGAGGLLPVASAVVGDTFPPERRGRALGMIGAVFGIAFLLGPLLGGLLLRFGWPWLFLINLPIAAALLVGTQRWMPASRPVTPRPFDWAGSLLLGGSLASLTLGLSRLDTARGAAAILDPTVGPLLLLALFLLAAFAVVERRAADPVVHPRLLASGQIRLVGLFAFAGGLTEASMVFLPTLAVASLGSTVTTASFMLLPLVTAVAIGAPLAGRLVDRLGARPIIAAGLSLTALGLFGLGTVGGTFAGFAASAAVVGLGLSALVGAPLRYLLLQHAAPEDRGAAQGVLTVFGSTGRLVGGALVGAIAASAAGADGIERALLVLGALLAASVFGTLGLEGRKRRA
jgi:EmrB/QacA subfamily drug resistance transporter